MKLQDFIEAFSHNNEVNIENKDNYCMQYRYLPEDNLKDELMDWELRYTDIRDCEVICIKNVIRLDAKSHMRTPAITIKIDTDKKEFEFLKSLVTRDNAPLWLYNKMHRTNIVGGDVCCGA